MHQTTILAIKGSGPVNSGIFVENDTLKQGTTRLV